MYVCPIKPPYRLCYRERYGLRELLEFEPDYRWKKRRCANCGWKQTESGEEKIEAYRMFPGERYRMDGFVALCERCKPRVLPKHQKPNSCFTGASISRPVMGMPIHVLGHRHVSEYSVSRAVSTLWRHVPRRDRKKIKDYILDDQREDSKDGSPVVGRGELRIEALWDWPSRERNTIGVCAARGHTIRVRSSEVKSSFEELLSLLAHEMAHTFQHATGSVLITDYAKRKDECETDADEIAARWGAPLNR